MLFGVIVNACSVIFGGLIGAFLRERIPKRLRLALPLTFGATFILPLTTPAIIADFTSLGGMIMLSTGFRISVVI